MKTLYNILGVDPAASTAQIAQAYITCKIKLETAASALTAEETSMQRIAIRNAYTTLSNPILRKRYDERLAEYNARDAVTENSAAMASGSIFGLKSIVLLGAILLGGIYSYNDKAKERERLRIMNESKVQVKAVQIPEEGPKELKAQDLAAEGATPFSSSPFAQSLSKSGLMHGAPVHGSTGSPRTVN